jgi:hypothetical protein
MIYQPSKIQGPGPGHPQTRALCFCDRPLVTPILAAPSGLG